LWNTREYDAAGKQLRSTLRLYYDGNLAATIANTYDQNGNETYKTDISSPPLSLILPNVKSTYEYVLDGQGNWTKQTESQEVTKFGQTYWEPKTATYRTITYY
jgi:hypothetical protein